MSAPTPLTNLAWRHASYFREHPETPVVPVEFARNLERENAMLKEKVRAAVTSEQLVRAECNRLRGAR